MEIRLGSRFLTTASLFLGLAFTSLGTVATASGIATVPIRDTFPEPYCAAGRPAAQAFYLELNAGKSRTMHALADKAEAAAAVLGACARSAEVHSEIEKDRLRVRAADALFIAAEARRRLGQAQQRIADLRGLLGLIGDLDSQARVHSNAHLYQEARLLRRYSRYFLRGASA